MKNDKKNSFEKLNIFYIKLGIQNLYATCTFQNVIFEYIIFFLHFSI